MFPSHQSCMPPRVAVSICRPAGDASEVHLAEWPAGCGRTQCSRSAMIGSTKRRTPNLYETSTPRHTYFFTQAPLLNSCYLPHLQRPYNLHSLCQVCVYIFAACIVCDAKRTENAMADERDLVSDQVSQNLTLLNRGHRLCVAHAWYCKRQRSMFAAQQS